MMGILVPFIFLSTTVRNVDFSVDSVLFFRSHSYEFCDAGDDLVRRVRRANPFQISIPFARNVFYDDLVRVSFFLG